MKTSANVVRRFCPLMDRFVTIRLFTETEGREAMSDRHITTSNDYIRSLIEVCYPDYLAEIAPFLQTASLGGGAEPGRLEMELYTLALMENPHLDIRRVTLAAEEGAALPLLEAGEAADGEGPLPLARFLELEELLGARVIGQTEAVEKLARVLRRSAAGLRDPHRPLGSLFFLGQTGVGKTELARALADVLFGKDGLVRIDCSEFGQSHEYAKLIGAPPGYVGHQDGGRLTEEVAQKERCVVLFDEVEKAHPKVHQLLLQVMEDGVLTDSKGKKVNFGETVILFTSNVGARDMALVKKKVGFCERDHGCDTRKTALGAFEKRFSPEFINRLDEVVVFSPLGDEENRAICRLLLTEVERYLAPRRVTVDFADEVVEHLVREGTDARYGARPLRREIQRRVLTPLADELLGGRIPDGAHIGVSLDGEGEVVFTPEGTGEAGSRAV